MSCTHTSRMCACMRRTLGTLALGTWECRFTPHTTHAHPPHINAHTYTHTHSHSDPPESAHTHSSPLPPPPPPPCPPIHPCVRHHAALSPPGCTSTSSTSLPRSSSRV